MKKEVCRVSGGLMLGPSEGCGRRGEQKSSLGQVTEGLECPAMEFGLHSIAFEGYSTKGSRERDIICSRL